MTKPIIPWMGGKRRLAKYILPLFKPHKAYIEPFCGGAALFFMKEPSTVEILNDINGDIVNLYRVVKNHKDEFLRQFENSIVSRAEFVAFKQTPVDGLTDIQRAARFFFLQKMAFGGKPTGQTFGTATTSPPKFNPRTVERDIKAANTRLQRVYIESMDWLTCIRRYAKPHSLIYLDPPYWQTAGYGTDFDFDNYQAMADFARKTKAQVVISINDTPEIRAVFKGRGLRTRAVDITYTVGGASVAASPSPELIITN